MTWNICFFFLILDQWKTEVERFSFLRVLVIRGTNRKEVNVSELKKFDIVITSYKVRNHGSLTM
jgi:SNF2 family DNA or RNA helicase